MITTTFYYLVEFEKDYYRYIDFNITHEPFNSEADRIKTHEEIGPLFLAKQFNVSIDKIKPITKEQYDLIPDDE